MLPAREGLSITDADYVVHRFKTYGSREFQCIMMIEVKTFTRKLPDAQRDTLYILHQLMRNRRDTPTKETLHQSGTTITKAHSFILGRDVNVRSFGTFVLTFSESGPEDSDEIFWNKERITEETLVSLLRFELDPETRRPIDLRSHHKPPPQHPELSLITT